MENETKIEFKVDMEEQKVNATAPWGEMEMDLNDQTSLIKFALVQLKSYQTQGNKTQSLKDDIAGYEEILSSKDPKKNADLFLEKKHEYLTSGSDKLSNLEVIAELRKAGKWVQ